MSKKLNNNQIDNLYFRSTNEQSSLDDRTNVLANALRQRIEIQHVPSGRIVAFKAFVTQFDDQYQTEFSQEQVFGRMDSIQTYRGTTRQINLSWDVPSSSEMEAEIHLERCSTLMTMLYPVYTNTADKNSQGKILTAPPVFKIKFANLITNTASRTAAGGVEENGLFGTISGFSYTPDMESGFFTRSNGDLLPQTISLSCTFTVVHTHDLGWENKGEIKKANENFPYGSSEQSGPTKNSPAQAASAGSSTSKQQASKELNALKALGGSSNNTGGQ